MAIAISGSGTITGISQGGLNDNIITQSELANTGVAGNGPAFSAYSSSGQTISASTLTKIQFNSERFDTANCFDSTTNYRFTPNVAGYYSVSIGFNGTNTNSIAVLYKTGSEYGSALSYATATGARPRYSTLVYMNGTTDYIEAYGYVTADTTLATSAVSSDFNAVLVRAA